MGYKKLPRERRGFLVEKQKFEKEPIVKQESSKIKEETIEQTIFDIDSQLNTLALIVMQLAEQSNLNTPEYLSAKQAFIEIQGVLNG